jgi:opacity protein-like surface antigen
MKKNLILAVALFATALPLSARNWSLGVHSGPFVFGDFVERKVRPSVGGVLGDPVTMSLSAATRAGLAVDVQRDFGRRWGVRLEGTFTRAPLTLKEEGEDALTFDAGELSVTTVMLPIVFRVNPEGTFRFYVMAGPAYAMYDFEPQAHSGAIEVISRTENEWGAALGGGVGWWFSDHFAVEGTLTDIATTSPFKRDDFPDVPGYSIPKPHNVHTTVGVRLKF